MRPGCESGPPVPAYGDPAADVHVIGDHPGIHGGRETGVPFTGSRAGERLQGVLYEVGLLGDPYADEPTVSNLFLSYLHMCAPTGEGAPPASSYARLDRYFDAELRAVNAHVLLPVGRRASDQVIETHSTQFHKVPTRMDHRHAIEVRGRGFLVIPIRDPADWTGTDRRRLIARLRQILASDYRQTKGVATLIG